MPEHFRLGTIGSSNDLLLRMADDGAAEHTIVVAREQREARGGSGPWHAPLGGLWFSTLWRPRIDACSAAVITLAAGWAVAEGIRRYTGVRPGLKWPNDVLIESRKVAGVLVEGRVKGHDVVQAVIGVGINVNNPPLELPETVAENATSLQTETGLDLDLDGLLQSVSGALRDARVNLVDRHATLANFRRSWVQKAADVSIDCGHTMVEGRAVRIDEEGCLVVRTSAGGEHRIDDPSLAKFVRVV